MKLKDFSIDCESLALGTKPAIVSIAVANFDIETGKIGATFYREITFDSAVKAGDVDGSTIQWWLQQNDKARRIFMGKDKVPLSVALDDMRAFICDAYPNEVPNVWACGPAEDITWLNSAFKNGAVGLSPPWMYSRTYDMRTACLLAGYTGDDWPFKREGVHHNALDDAVYQAGVISACWRRVRDAITGKKGKPVTVQSNAKPANFDPELDDDL